MDSYSKQLPSFQLFYYSYRALALFISLLIDHLRPRSSDFTVVLSLSLSLSRRNAASHIAEFAARDCIAIERVEGVYQSEGWVQKVFVSHGFLLAFVLHVSSPVRVRVDRRG